MAEAADIVHVACSASAAGPLRDALPLLGSTERVIGSPDSLSVGPIDPPDPKARQAWSKSTLRNAIDVDPVEMEKAWAAAFALAVDLAATLVLRPSHGARKPMSEADEVVGHAPAAIVVGAGAPACGPRPAGRRSSCPDQPACSPAPAAASRIRFATPPAWEM